jgi:hypothetical protein
MAYQNTYQQPAQAAVGQKKEKPSLKIYLKDANGKRIDDSEIALWENKSKTGKTYFSGKDKKGNKYVGFPSK